MCAKLSRKKTSRKKTGKASASAKPVKKIARPAKSAGTGGRTKLSEYKRKRDFRRTSEPEPKVASSSSGFFYCIQKHAASHLHYDLRLELDGVLKSWAVPKGPSLDPSVRRLAMHVEDHPLDYGNFEGTIPKGEYGGGTVMLWDRGQWRPKEDPHEGYRTGRLKFELAGEKLQGGWMLVRRGGAKAGPEERTWFWIKERDAHALDAAKFDIVEELPLSVSTGRDLDDIAAGAKPKKTAAKPKKNAAKPKKSAAKPKSTIRKAKATARTAPVRGHAKRTSGREAASVGVRAAMPTDIEPQLATLVKRAPDGDNWVHEIKFDGYRMICRLASGKAKFLSRRNQDWTERFGSLVEAVEELPLKQAIFDGEVVVLEADGTTSFQALQNMLSENRTRSLVYYTFDLLYLDGRLLTSLPLEKRKQLLSEVVMNTRRGPLRFVEHIEGRGPSVFDQACKAGLEGIISKRRDAPYRPGRGDSWVKTKCSLREEFVIVGFSDPSHARGGFGALLLGYHDDDGALVYAGRVGTGFTHKSLLELRERLERLERDTSPLGKQPTVSPGKGVHWVKPTLVAEVEFSNWTRDGILRHPSFQGLREDKRPEEVVRDVPREPPRSSGSAHAGAPSHKNAGRKISGQTKSAPAKSFAAKSPAPKAVASKSASGKAVAAKSAAAKPKSRARPSSRGGSAAKNGGKLPAARASGEATVEGIRITHPERVLYPEQGITKLRLAEYYAEIADWIMPHVAHRPLSLVRCPEGRGKQCFFQKHARLGTPEALGRVRIQEKNKADDYLVVEDVAGLVSLVQFGVLEIHLWGALAADFEHPDRLTFDLDPAEGLPWKRVIDAARLLRSVLEALGLVSFVKTTGGKGLHVVVPIRPKEEWDEVRQFCKAVVERIVAEAPGQFTANMSKAARPNKIFLDYFRNDRGATAVAAYSTRARAGAPVSAPIDWDELRTNLGGDHYTVANLPRRLSSLKRDPWAELPKVKQSITAPMKKALGI